jgi:hypothetical protein
MAASCLTIWSGFGIQDLENLSGYPPVSDAHASSRFLYNTGGRQPPQHVGGSGLAELEAVLQVPDSEYRISEEQVDRHMRPSAALEPRSVSFPQVRELLGSLHGIRRLHSYAVQKELQPLCNFSALANVLQPVVVVALAAIEVTGQVEERRREPARAVAAWGSRRGGTSPSRLGTATSRAREAARKLQSTVGCPASRSSSA